MLKTVGARSGRPRTVPLFGIRDGDNVVIIGTNFGQPRQPAWYHNLRAHPEVTLILPGGEGTYIAREATFAEREKYWKKGDEIYTGYSAYRQRVRGREIPIVVLTPKPVG
jgi:deazaflavin-dependent oxidoreductase (nitroreductase family)